MAWGAELAEPNQLIVRYQPSKTQMGALIAAIQQSGLEIADITTEQSDLEDIFLQITRDSSRAA
jgi:ABC-2 type transport system ATP-binding protein